jgi:hypothetical protein
MLGAVNLDKHSDQTLAESNATSTFSGPIQSWLNAEYEDDEAGESDEG